MAQQSIYNLKEFAAEYLLPDVYGAYTAHFSVNGADGSRIYVDSDKDDGCDFMAMMGERTLFTKLLLVERGTATVCIDSNTIEISENTLLVVTPSDSTSLKQWSAGFRAECVLVDEHITDRHAFFRLQTDKYNSVHEVFQFIKNIVSRQHINKIEMIRSMVNLLKLFIEELPYEECPITRDLGHKKQIYEIFLHHLYKNFRKNRQIRFYADKLNVSTAYLSRVVKEISGSTVNDHVTSLVYKELCNLLHNSDMTMGEISDSLSFSDQSAMTNFFKLRSGISPLQYRNRKDLQD